MKKFEIVKVQTDSNHEILESYDTEKEARERFKNYESIIEDLGSYYLITEFYLEENYYNENGYVSFRNILDITETHPKKEIDEVWEVAEKAINDTYKKRYNKTIKEAFTDIAEEVNLDYAVGCQAYMAYMAQIKVDSELADWNNSTDEEIYKDFSEWYETSDMFSKITIKDVRDYQ